MEALPCLPRGETRRQSGRPPRSRAEAEGWLVRQLLKIGGLGALQFAQRQAAGCHCSLDTPCHTGQPACCAETPQAGMLPERHAGQEPAASRHLRQRTCALTV